MDNYSTYSGSVYEYNDLDYTTNDNDLQQYFAEKPRDIKKEKKKYFGRFLWKLALSLLIINIAQVVLVTPYFVVIVFSEMLSAYSLSALDDIVDFIVGLEPYIMILAIPIGDLIGFVALILLTIRDEKTKPEKRKLKFKYFFTCVMASFGFSFVGSIVGNIVHGVLTLPANIIQVFAMFPFALANNVHDIDNSVVSSIINASDSWVYLILVGLVVGILGPILEELMFRKVLVDRTLKYGIGASVLLSGLFFGLFHGNFQQLFYTIPLGCISAFLYIYSGKMIYSYILHILFNSFSAFVLPFWQKLSGDVSLQQVGEDIIMGKGISFESAVQSVSFIILILCYLAMFAIDIAGVVVAAVNIKKYKQFRKTMPMGEEGTKKCAAFNYGAYILYGGIIILFLISYNTIYLQAAMLLLEMIL